jgi:ferredoxin
VAEGTYLIDAARRMGVPLGSGCTAGKGECPACLVSVSSQTAVLSPPGAAETKWLGETQLAQSVRLACQVKIETAGELVVTSVAREPQPQASQNEPSNLRKKFGDLPLEQKIATLLQLEAVTMSEAFNAAIEKPLALGNRALDAVVARTRSARQRMRQK